MIQHVRKKMLAMRRVMSMLLVFVMLFTSVDMTGFAAEPQTQSEPQAQAETTNVRVVGTFNDLTNGQITDWQTDSSFALMEKVYGDYYYKCITFPEVTSESGYTLKFKIFQGSNWDGDDFGGGDDDDGNYVLTIPKGSTQIEIFAITTENVRSISVSCGTSESVSHLNSVAAVTGNFADKLSETGLTNWTPGDVNGHMQYLGNGYFYKKIIFAEKTDSVTGLLYKVVFNDVWNGYIGGSEADGNAAVYGEIPAGTSQLEIIADIYGNKLYNSIDNPDEVASIYEECKTEVEKPVTLHFRNSEDWEANRIHSWLRDFRGADTSFTDWPGAEVEVGNQYRDYITTQVTYNAVKDLYFIISNGGDETNRIQLCISKNDLKENTEWWVYHNGTEYVVTPTNPESVTLNQSTLELEVGKTEQLEATTLVPSGITLTWSSSDTSVATVDNGKVTAVGAGTATITATTPTGKTATCTVTIKETIKLEKPDSLDLNAGETVTLTATTNPANKDVTWISSDESVATVVGGKVTAVGAGTATITAYISDNETVKETCTVTVSETITLPETFSLEEGTTAKLAVTTQPKDITVTWESSDKNVATVDENGNITAIAEGETTITATTAGKNGVGSATETCTVTVTKKSEIPATDIKLDADKKELVVEDSFILTATTTPASKTVIWTSSNDEIATVENGVVTAKKAGTVTITATVDNETTEDVTATCTVTVVEQIELNKTALELKVNEITTLEATKKVPSDTTVTWSTSDAEVATVDAQTGEVTAVGKGTATITATTAGGENGVGKAAATCTVTVEEAIELEKTSTILVAGETETLTIASINAKDETVTWSSSNDKIATVDQDGVVTAVSGVAGGKAIITATTAGGATATCEVTVTETIELDVESIALVTGTEIKLTATTKPENTVVTWSSSNQSVATVDGTGKVTAVAGVANGKATITAETSGGAKATCIVEVTVKSPVVAGNKVIFNYEGKSGDKVYLAGTMNGWSTTATPFAETAQGNGIFTCSLELAPGRYEYKFVVNGGWTHDTKNALRADSSDNANSVLIVPGITTTSVTLKKGGAMTLPSELVDLSADGTETMKAVTAYTSNTDGVTVTDKKVTLENFTGKEFEVTATTEDNQTVIVKVQLYEPEDITIKIHYDRSDDKESEWNAWAWGDNFSGENAGYMFVEENGEYVATFKVPADDVFYVNLLKYKIRLGNWLDQERERHIDLSAVIGGTVHISVKADGTDEINYSEAVLGTKLNGIDYNRSDNTIAVSASGLVINPNTAFEIKKANGTPIAVTGVKASGTTYTLSLGEDITGLEKVCGTYKLTYDGLEYFVTMPNLYKTEEFENAYTYDRDDLGATWTEEKTTFKVWAPTAESVKVQLYATGSDEETGSQKLSTYTMTKGEGDKGVWSVTVNGDLNGVYYTYLTEVNGTVEESCDPYARTTGVNGERAMVINLDDTDPDGWDSDKGPNDGMDYTDAVIYELHVRDLSIEEESGVKDEWQGKFLGLTQTGTTNADGHKTGLDHIIDLGVTHIHLLPVYDYASIDETMSEADKAANPDKQFNWGYDPENYNVPEGSYSTNPYKGDVRVKEMKEMVQTLHENNINVIMDVVYNHVYDAGNFCVNEIVPNYFSRTNPDGSFSDGSGCGNDTASERSMVRKYIVDSVLYWAEEYHIDGFRFDLVGLLDAETINLIVKEVHEVDPDIVFYGEGWTLGTAVQPSDTIMATQANAWATPYFAYFSDTFRDFVKGRNDETSWGYIQNTNDGDPEGTLMEIFKANTSWIQNPTQVVNYASCHDNYTLKDKINATTKDSSEADRIKMNNLAASIYMLAEGIPLIHAGEEILRTKVDSDGHIVHNSYNVPDYINSLKWDNLDKEEYRDVVDYYSGLIEFRKNHAALRLTTKTDVNNYVREVWVDENIVLFDITTDNIKDEVSDGIVIIFNSTKEAKTFSLYGKNAADGDIGVSEGTWQICINDKDAGTEVLGTVTDGQVTVPAISALVLVKGETVDTSSVYTANNQVKLTLDNSAVTMVSNGTLTLNATVNPADSTLIWTSSDEKVVTVENGVLTAKDAGKATITVSTLHGITAACEVIVIEGSIALDNSALKLGIGETAALKATTIPADAELTWTSNNTDVATVDENGKVTAKALGTAVITVTTPEGNTAECTVTVKETIKLDKAELTLVEGEDAALTATTNPADVKVTWTSSDEKVATVDSDGTVKTLSPGTAVITAATPTGEKASCTVTVKQKPYTYTIYVYSSNKDRMNINNSVMYIWDKSGNDLFATVDNHVFTETETLSDGRTWLKTTFETTSSDLGLIFKSNGSWDWKTADYVHANKANADQTIYIVDNMEGTYTELPTIKESPVVNGNQVTFYYYDTEDSVSKLYLKGIVNGWDGVLMTEKDNVFSYTTTLPAGVYEYKFQNPDKGNDGWFTDPLNSSYTYNDDGSIANNKLIITGAKQPADNILCQKGGEVTLPSQLEFVKADGTTEQAAVTYSVKDADAEKVSITDGKLTVAADYAGKELEIIATANGVSSSITVNVFDKEYTYTIYLYSAIEERVNPEYTGLWTWDKSGEQVFADQELAFTTETLSDGRTWLKAEFKTISEQLGFLLKSKGEGVWDWKGVGDIVYTNTAKDSQTIYLVDGYTTAFTSLSDVPEEKYVYVEYGGTYDNTYAYAWSTGYSYWQDGQEKGLHIPFKEINGQYIAKIPVVAGDADKTIGFLVQKGTDFSQKEGGDNNVKILKEDAFAKVRFENGKITKTLSATEGVIIDRKNDTITFYFRDKDLFIANNLAALDGKVTLVVKKESNGTVTALEDVAMKYDEENERFYAQIDLTDDTDYYYFYDVDGNKVLDANNTRTGVLNGETYSLVRNKVYNVTLTATVLNGTMDYNDNNVISLTWAPKTEADSLAGFNPEHIYLDLSALGQDSSAEMDLDLLAYTFGCTDTTSLGDKQIKVTLVDDCGQSYYTTATVKVVERTKTANTADKLGDFDWDEAVIYFAVTDRFFDGNTSNNTITDGYDKNGKSSIHGGDFAGLTEKIDYLYDLGVNTIWLTPIVDNIDENMRNEADGIKSYAYHGYWTEDFTELNPHLGTEAELKALITAAHAKGMKVMVDVVLNHAGYGTEDYFNSIIAVEGAVDSEGNQVYKDMIRETSIDGDEEKMSLSGLPDFLTEDAEVREQLIKWQTSWMKAFDIDYYRVDTVKHVDDTTWEAFKNELTKIDPDFKLIGEYYDGGYRNDFDQLGSGKMDSLLDFHFNDILTNLASENLAAIEKELQTRNGILNSASTMGSFLSSHDENGFLYDLIHSHGESEEWANALMKVAATYQITAKGQPVIYYGEELGLTGANNYPHQDNRYDFDWSLATDANPMYKHYKTMLNIRRDYSEVFAKGDRYSVVISDKHYYDGSSTDTGYDVFARSYEGETIYVGTNVWGDAKTLTFNVNGAAGSEYKDLYNGKTYTVSDKGTVTVTIPGAANGGTVVLVKTSGEETAAEDTNKITVKIHYKRDDNDYSKDWNAWLWSDTTSGARYDFEDVNGEKVATITVDGRKTNTVNYRIRVGDWKENDHNGKDQSIDISDIVSGTVHYYIQSGVWGGVKVLGADAVMGEKVVASEFDRTNNRFIITTNRPITGNLVDAFTIRCVSDKKDMTITSVVQSGCTYYVYIEEELSAMKEVLKTYALYFDGYEYTLTMPNIYSTQEFENAYTYEGDDLGLTYTKTASTLKVWAPTAENVVLNVYESGTKGTNDLIKSYNMTLGEKGVWSYTLDGDWNGKYYTYSVTVNNETNEVCDPYARTTGVNGNRAMILDLDSTDPEGWANDTGAHKDMEYTDAVIYELHVRDLSIDESSGVSDANKGKFLGLTETGTTTADGTSTGLDHMIDLGVTHVHLLPIYDYASVDETKLDTPQFNWGYDPLNYNVPEGSYSTDPYDGAVRVNEMKQMVMALHENNINVIMDVVYNHVYDAGTFGFNQIVPSYFSRTNADGSFSNGSGCGNDTATERSMVHKYVVESILYWHEEYHIDGFRFDLVGLLDTETINTIVEEVHKIDPDIIFYGEGWTLGTAVSKDGYSMATQANAKLTPEFAYFSDTLRNGVAGSDTNGQGFIWGTDVEDLMRQCFTATTWWCPEPIQTINYVSCHDNYTLMDKINEVSNAAYNSYDDAPGAYQTRLNNLAASFYMLSEGIPLVHAGEEFLRTKLEEGTNTVIHNSYNASDYVNKLRWYNLDGDALYADTVDYYEGLIEFRKNHEALRLSTKEEVAANVKYNWVTNDTILFTINGKSSVPGEVSDGIVVIFNASDNSQNINLYNYGAANGTWKVCIDADNAGTDVLSTVTNGNVTVPYKSVMVLVKGETVDTESVYTANNKVSISLDRTVATVGLNGTTTLHATVNPADSTLVWTSADESIATVDENGKVTGLKAGTTTIIVRTLHDVMAACEVTVTEEEIEETIALDQTAVTLKENETAGLKATVTPEGTYVTWSSNNTAVAVVDENGNVTAVAAGTAVITAETPSGVKAECTVTVKHELTFVGAKEATCTTDGNVEHYVCNDCAKYFADELGKNELTKSEVIVKATGVHTWNYAVSGNKITVNCTSDADCAYAKAVSITVTAENAAYSGEAYTGAQLENADAFNTATGNNLTEDSIQFYSDEACTKKTEPIAVGTYYAAITVDGVTAKAAFEIYDKIAPTGSITVADDKWAEFLNEITFGIFFKETQKVTIIAEDNAAVDQIYYYVANDALALDEVKALADTDWNEIRNGGSFHIEPNAEYVIYAKIIDESGNITYISSDGLVVDAVVPEITELEDDKIYCESVTFTVIDAYMDKVTVDGEELKADENGNYTISADGKTHTVIAIDKAGNSVSRTITVYDGHNWSSDWVTDKDNHWHVCTNGTCTEISEKAAHADNDRDCYCDICQYQMSDVLFAETSTEVRVDNSVRVSVVLAENEEIQGCMTEDANIAVAELGENNTVEITGVNVGTTTITVVTKNGAAATCEVTVKERAVTLDKASLALLLNGTDTLTAKLAEGETIAYWASNHEAVVTVEADENSNTATLKAVAAGSAIISVRTESGAEASCMVTVSDNSVALNYTTLEMTEGDTVELHAVIGDSVQISGWSSSDEEVVSVSSSLADVQTATLEALKAGTATITVTAVPVSGGGVMPRTGSETFTASCTITVKEKEKVTLDQTELTLKQGETGKLTATVNTEAQIIWYSDDIRVARVDENGNILAVGAGTAVITAETPNGTKASCMVTVESHDLIMIEAAAPTCTTDGNIAYYRCEVCGKLFADEYGTIVLEEADTVVKATGKHTFAYTASGKQIIASCTSDLGCMYADGVSVTVNATDAAYSGKDYTGAQLVDVETFNTVTGNNLTAENIFFYSDEACTKETEPVAVGTYYAAITVEGATAKAAFEIYDDAAPTGTIKVADDKWAEFLNTITFGIFFKETQKVTITAEDNDAVGKIYYYVANDALTLEEVKAFADTDWTEIQNGGSFNIEPNNTYVIYAKITDASGNITYISSDGLVVDAVVPEIMELEDGKIYCESVTFTVSDTYMDKVTVDGVEVTADEDGNYTISADGKTHTVVVTDKAGNSVSRKITVYDGHNWSATWSTDEDSHWHVCTNGTCTEISEKAAHADADRDCYCDICQYQMSDVLFAETSIEVRVDNSVSVSVILAANEEIQGCMTADANIAVAELGENNTVEITGVNVGTTTITVVTQNGAAATCEVTVKERAVTLDKESIALLLNGTDTLTAALADGETIAYWTSNHEAVVTVEADENGNTATLKAVAAGSAIISVRTESGAEASCMVTVSDNSIALDYSTLEMTEGDTAELHAVIGDSVQISGWASSDEEVVSVTSSLADPQTAALTALKAGTVTITVTATKASGGGIMPRTGGETFTASCTITVKEKEKVTLDQTELTLKQGETGKLTATVNTEAQVIWYSDDIRVARVDENGNILAVGAGTAVITAETPNGTKASCTVKVQAHDLILVDAKAPTCTEDGHRAYYRCEVCGKLFSDEYGTVETTLEEVTEAALGHKSGEVVVENEVKATCEKAGSYDEVTYCTECKAELSRVVKVIEKLEHKAGEAVVENKVEATCEKAGSYDEVTYCTECKAELSRESKTIEKLAHNYKKPKFDWSSDFKSATATFTCKNDKNHVLTVDATITEEITKEASNDKKGKITYTATVTLDGETYTDTKQKKFETVDNEQIGEGTVSAEVVVSENVTETVVDNFVIDNVKELFTEEELKEAEEGADLKVYLEVTDINDTVEEEQKVVVKEKVDTVVEEIVKTENLSSKEDVKTEISYFDFSLYKEVGDKETEKLEKTGKEPFVITIQIPEEMKSDNKEATYHVIRVHGNEVTILPTKADREKGTLTFETDRFSTYAVVYTEPIADTPAVDTPPADDVPSTEDTPSTENTPPVVDEPTSPPTGEYAWYIIIMMAGFGVYAVARKNKKEEMK